MRRRALLLVSLSANLALAVVLWFSLSRRSEPAPLPPLIAPSVTTTSVVRTNVVVRRQNFVWSQIESEDYPTYIRNLRSIGCPESTIRDIIVAEVDQLFARRRAAEVTTAPQQWWRADPDPEVTRAAVEKLRALEQERRALLTRLLGADWESADYPWPSLETVAPLDGPVLGSLPPDTRLAIQRVERAALERQRAYVAAQEAAGLPPDAAELHRLRQETRSELARVMPPEALQEYLLRYSQEAVQLREKLRGFDTSPEEFRALFGAFDPIDQQLASQSAATDPLAVRQREQLERQKEALFQETLGAERYDEYRLTQDTLYQQAREIARRSGVSSENILPLAAIYRVTELAEQRIRADTALSAEEKTERLEAARLAQENSLRRLLGEEAYQRYLKSQNP